MAEVPGKGSVQIRIDGLTLSRYRKANAQVSPLYEVDILPQKGHEFTICCEVIDNDSGATVGGAQVAPPVDGLWRLEILKRPPDATLFVDAQTQNFNRKDLSEKILMVPSPIAEDHPIRKDFRWVLDLESKEFEEHKPPMKVRRDKLRPIIQFPHGQVFNAKLSRIRLERSVGGGGAEPFGIVSDIVGIDIDAKPGDLLVLHDEDGQNLFVIPVEEKRQVLVNIRNIPPDLTGQAHQASHFHLLYNAFKDVPKKYDIQAAHRDRAQELSAAALTVDARARGDAEIQVCGGGFGGGDAPLCGNGHAGQQPPISE